MIHVSCTENSGKMKLKLTCILVVIFSVLAFYGESISLEYSGMIVTDIGRPAANATITVQNVADPSKTFSAVTDTTGLFSFVITDVEQEQQSPFKLYGNFPNPFNPYTRISYSLDVPGEVNISIYNILGQEVRALDQGLREQGYYTAIWDGKDDTGKACSAGVYLYKLSAGERFLTSKMLLVDASTGSWISARRVPEVLYKDTSNILYLVTVTHPDAETLSLGPMTINETTDTVLTINRIMTKMELVKKNTYFRGTDKLQYPVLRPLHKVQITHDFLMDKYEVTPGVFCNVMNHALARGAIIVEDITAKNLEGDSQLLFLFETPGRSSKSPIQYTDGIFSPREGWDKIPVSFVSWYGAMFYCYERNIFENVPQTIDVTDWSVDLEISGYRLPTDAEWELAARWTDVRDYTWGPDPGHYKPMNTQLNDDGYEVDLSPAGWFSPQGDSHDGLCDMSGNVYEWVIDWQHDYDLSWADGILVDPVSLSNGGLNKIARSGSAFGCFRAARTFDKANMPIGETLRGLGLRTIRVINE